jgi:predicted AAA+ superfamily ATPase
VAGSADNKVSLGRRLENAVYLELRRRNYGAVWVGKQDDKEVDFIVQNKAGDRAYYQVAWTATDEATLDRELSALRKIKDSHPKFLITTDAGNGTLDGIKQINAMDWLLNP